MTKGSVKVWAFVTIFGCGSGWATCIQSKLLWVQVCAWLFAAVGAWAANQIVEVKS